MVKTIGKYGILYKKQLFIYLLVLLLLKFFKVEKNSSFYFIDIFVSARELKPIFLLCLCLTVYRSFSAHEA